MGDRKKTPDVMGTLLGDNPQSPPESTPLDHPTSAPAHQHNTPTAAAAPVKATYYLSAAILDDLEQAWFSLRQLVPPDERRRVSKSSIVETALELALTELHSRGDQSQLTRTLVGK